MFKPIREVKTSKMVSKNNLSFQNYKKYNTIIKIKIITKEIRNQDSLIRIQNKI